MIEIPIETEGKSYFSLSCNTGDVNVYFRFLWNDRDSRWFCDFESVDGKNYGVRIVPNSKLLKNSNKVCSSGDFVVLKSQASSEESLGFDNFGTVFKFYYLDEDDYQYFEGLL